MYGPGHGWGFGLFWQIGAFLGGLVLTAAIVVLAILLVRYLIVATRAAQLYVDTHSPAATPPATTSTETPPAATEPPPATPPSTKPAPRPRTPKTPPAAL
ncbi:hypothetical protein [Pseudolysinimonas sp.]|jgi:hypothetical protein|uniref:hypothetical protein n=1 Tax=Pseudolysinimonas sp. TaxID=2680009 RepID=UPI0037841C37